MKKCPYCDFNSHQRAGALPEADYLQRLLADLTQDLPYSQGRKLQSVFIGGGTPSLFSAAGIAFLLREAEALLPFADPVEITLEANPGTFEQRKFSAFREAGINRLSIGIQSFQDSMLQRLGRAHGGQEARRAVEIATQAGFDNLNLDLMFALPGQDQNEALQDLETAIAGNPSHISWYQLTIEPNTRFYRSPPALPSHDEAADMQAAGLELLARHGYSRYEISAFSRPGAQCRHNRNYWEFGDYLGIGAGAHGKITLPAAGEIVRTRKTRQPRAYLQGGIAPKALSAQVPAADLPLEYLMNAMRLHEGVSERDFEARTGLPIQVIERQLQDLRGKGLMTPGRLAPTAKGRWFLDDLLAEFAPEGACAQGASGAQYLSMDSNCPPLEGGLRDRSLLRRHHPPPAPPAPKGLAPPTPPQGGSDWSA